jgi:hypothetical protein
MKANRSLESCGLAVALTLLGCSEKSGGDGQGVDDLPAPERPTENQPVGYPKGPYGIGIGSVIANYTFVGYPDGENKATGLKPIQLADFFNPTGKDVYPKDSQYGPGSPKPLALVINVSSVWCGPCNDEARRVLPGKHAAYKPEGGEFLLQLADGATPGVAATQKNLDSWTTVYTVDYPATIDPAGKLAALFDADTFPANLIVDTRTMKIVKSVSGVPDASFWTTFENTITSGTGAGQ